VLAVKTAWLIELRGMTAWGRVNGALGWTTDANAALKFADRKSAEDMADLFRFIFSGCDCFVSEHGWPEGF
jgi:hypothetical protein